MFLESERRGRFFVDVARLAAWLDQRAWRKRAPAARRRR
jgi:hypothetical protein